ncbi:hypothetical protein NEFER03_2247 [Nematocida sp. LUAm3]|nr:hypothetical protein NEFER03_2247 [Nematocida sp. LUAm3]
MSHSKSSAYGVIYTWRILVAFLMLMELRNMVCSTEIEVDADGMEANGLGNYVSAMRGCLNNSVEHSGQSNPMPIQDGKRESDREREIQSVCEVLTNPIISNEGEEKVLQGHNMPTADDIKSDKDLIAQTFLKYFDIFHYIYGSKHWVDKQSFYERIEYNQEKKFFSINLPEYTILTKLEGRLPHISLDPVLEGLLGRIRAINCEHMSILSNISPNLIKMLIERTVVTGMIWICNLKWTSIHANPLQLTQNANPQPNTSEEALSLGTLKPIMISIGNCSTDAITAILSWTSIRLVEKLSIYNCQLSTFNLKGIRLTEKVRIDIEQNGDLSYSIAFKEIQENQQVILHLFGSSKLKEITVEKGATIPLHQLYIQQAVLIDFIESYKEEASNPESTRKNLEVELLEIDSATQTYDEIKDLCTAGELKPKNIKLIPNHSPEQKIRHQSNKDFKSLQSALRNIPGIC